MDSHIPIIFWKAQRIILEKLVNSIASFSITVPCISDCSPLLPTNSVFNWETNYIFLVSKRTSLSHIINAHQTRKSVVYEPSSNSICMNSAAWHIWKDKKIFRIVFSRLKTDWLKIFEISLLGPKIGAGNLRYFGFS